VQSVQFSVVGATSRTVTFPAVHVQFAPLTVHKQVFFERFSRRPSAGCSLSPVVKKSTNTEQQRRKRISLLAEVEEPDCGQNAYEDHSQNFEHRRAFRWL
jgi:hypothetical protein